MWNINLNEITLLSILKGNKVKLSIKNNKIVLLSRVGWTLHYFTRRRRERLKVNLKVNLHEPGPQTFRIGK